MEHDDCIQGPCEGMAHAGVTDADSYRGVHRKALEVKGQATTENNTPINAYINHGRWVVNCPECNGAGLASRTIKVSCCFDCGAVFTQVVFPRLAPTIEQTLLKRPDIASRNWTTESIMELVQENKNHGVKG
jgi:hypothetical protein